MAVGQRRHVLTARGTAAPRGLGGKATRGAPAVRGARQRPCAREGRRTTSHAGSPHAFAPTLLLYRAATWCAAPGQGTGHGPCAPRTRYPPVAVAREATGTRRAQARRAVRRGGGGGGGEKGLLDSRARAGRGQETNHSSMERERPHRTVG